MSRLICIAVVLILTVLVSSCGKSPNKPSSTQKDFSEKRAHAVERLLANHLSNGGWVASVTDGELKQDGEALIWSSLAMGHLDCPTGDRIEAALIKPILESGDLQRMDPLGASWENRPLNFDGMSGWFYGVAKRWTRCRSAPLLSAWQAQFSAIDSRGGYLHRAVNVKLPPHWDTTAKAISWAMGVGSMPAQREIDLLTFEAGAWAQAVVTSKAACYRIHLGWLHLATLRDLGFALSPTVFCDAVKKVDMPLERHWCGYRGLEQYVDGFKFNEWDYRHQRCGDWESPDGNGDDTPGIDVIVAIDELTR